MGRVLAIAALLALSPLVHAEEDEDHLIEVRPGHSTLVELDREPIMISVTNEQIAQVVELKDQVLMVQGLRLGTTDMVVVFDDEDDPVVLYDISVQRDVAPLQRMIDRTVEP